MTRDAPIDLLRVPTDCDEAKLHPYFRILRDDPTRAPARAVINEVGRWLAPGDPHLVQEFQTSGFDQRLWKIYLWAAFREFGLDVTQLEAPDFRCTVAWSDFTVEATTAAPSTMVPFLHIQIRRPPRRSGSSRRLHADQGRLGAPHQAHQAQRTRPALLGERGEQG